MSRQVLVVRGGALPRSSGLGRAHHDLVDRLSEGQVDGYTLGETIEHDLAGGAFARWRRRRSEHPRRVSDAAKANNGSILHITDQEQAHLIPEDSDLPVSITIHDLFHLEPRRITTLIRCSLTRRRLLHLIACSISATVRPPNFFVSLR